MRRESYDAGLSGEAQALHYLTGLGMTPLRTRYRACGGEIDLILRDGAYLVFVEVKYRPLGHAGEGLTAVTRDKRRRMVQAASGFLSEMQDFTVPVRFDVVEITADGLRHVPNAFWPERT